MGFNFKIICAIPVSDDGSQKSGVIQNPIWMIIATIFDMSVIKGFTAEKSHPNDNEKKAAQAK